MNEVLGDADPPARGRKPVGDGPLGDGRLDDDIRPFDDLDDYGDVGDPGDGFDVEPGPFRRFVAKVATPESLAIAAIVIAAASYVGIPAVLGTANSLWVSRGFDPAFGGRVDAAGQFVVAAIGFALAIVSGRRKPLDDQPEERNASLAPMISGAALIIASISALLAVVAFLVAGTAHQPSDPGFQSVTSAPAPVLSIAPAPALGQDNPAPLPGIQIVPRPSAIANFVVVDPSTGALVTVGPSPST